MNNKIKKGDIVKFSGIEHYPEYNGSSGVSEVITSKINVDWNECEGFKSDVKISKQPFFHFKFVNKKTKEISFGVDDVKSGENLFADLGEDFLKNHKVFYVASSYVE